jgi:hypothetical protein
MASNLAMQGYCLSPGEARALWLGLRFSTGVCLILTAGALAVGFWVPFVALAAIGAVAGFSARHPFDYVWNAAARRLGGPAVPPSPARRRHAFKVATAMMLVMAGLFAASAELAAVVVGVMLLAACTTVTVTNLCNPSLALSLVDGRRARQVRAVT